MTQRFALASIALAQALYAAAADAEPLRVVNASPVVVIAAPPVAEPARLLADGRNEWSLATDWASNATVSTHGDEEILLDGESFMLTGRWRHGTGRWQWGIDLRYVFQGGGMLDNFINEYHDLFGFPEGDRPRLDDDRLDVVYRRAGATLLAVDGYSDGFGDIRLSAAWQAARSEHGAVALRAQVKLPTGDAGDLTGSGGVDVSLGVDAATRIAVSAWHLRPYGGFGVLLADEGDVLPQLRESRVLFAHAGIAWPAHTALTLNLQLDAHSAYYDSDLAELGNAVQITAGGVWHIASGWDLAIGVVEDISTHSSPDVMFHFDLRHRPLR